MDTPPGVRAAAATAAPTKAPTPSWRQSVAQMEVAHVVLYLAVFIDALAVAVIIPVFSVVYRSLEMSPIMFGLVGSVYSATQFLFNPVMGRLSDTYGRKRILLVSFLGSAISYLMLGFATSVTIVFISRITVGVVKQTMTICMSWITDTTSPADRVAHMSRIRTAFNVGFIAGPAVGGWLSAEYGPLFPATIAFALFILDFLLVAFLLPDRRHATMVRSRSSNALYDQLNDLWRLLRGSVTGRLLGVRFFTHLAVALARAGFNLYALEQLHVEPSTTAYIISYMGLMGAVMSGLVLPPLASRLGERVTLVLGAWLLIPAYFATVFVTNVTAYLVCFAVIALGQAALSTAIISVFTQTFPPSETGLAMGVAGSVDALAGIVAPLLSGVVTQELGVGAPGAVAALTVLIGYIIYVGAAKHKALPS